MTALVALEPARARVRGGDQREAGGELDRPHRARHDDPSVLEGLAEPLDRVAPELGELVEEEHPVVGERDLGDVDAYDLGIQALYELGPINLTAGYYYETESEGSYFEFGASSIIRLHERVSLIPSAQISYTDGWLMPQLDGLNYLDLRVSLPIKVAEHVDLTPYVGAALMLDALEDNQGDKLIGGVALSLTF
jgi:hypothetical protein